MDSSQWHDKAHFLQPTVKAITTVLGLPSSIWLLDETENVLRIAAAAELVNEYVHDAYLSLDEPCVAAEVFRTHETIIVKNIQADKRWKYKAEARKMKLKSAILVPLKIKKRIVGILNVYIPENMAFSFDEKKPAIESFAGQISATLRQVQGLETLNEVAGLISVVKEHDSDLFERILQSAQKVLDCKHVSIFLEGKDGELVLEATSSPQIKRKRFKPGEGLAGHVAQTGKSLLASDVRQHPQFVPGLSTEIEKRSMLLTPILLQNTCIGVISANIDELNGFDECDQKLMETLTSQVTIAIRNVRLFETEREQREEVERLRKSEQIINSNIDLEQVVEAVLDELHHVVECDKASVQLIRGDHRFLIGAEGFSMKDASPRLLRNVSDDPLIRKIVQSREVLVLRDVSDEPLWEQIPGTASVHSWIGAPLIVGDQAIGLLTIDHPKAGYYTQKDGENVAVFANQVSTAIYRSDFFQLMRSQAQALTELNNLTYQLLSIEQTQNIRELLTNIAEIAKKVLKADLIELYEYRQDQNTYTLPQISVGERLKPFVTTEKKIYEDSAIFQLIHRKKPLYVENTDVEATCSAPYTIQRKDLPSERFIIREKIQSTAAIPLRTGDESMGLMFANYRTPQTFTKEQQELIELFAHQVAIAIKNIRLYEEQSKNHSLLRRLIDSSPDHIYVKDRESRFLIANEAVMRSMEVTKMEDLIGKTDFDFHPSQIAAQYYADEQEIFTSGRPIINRGQPSRDPDTDALIWLLTTKVPFYDNQGHIVGLVGINRDITELKQMEEELRESERKLADIINFLPDATFVIDKERRVIVWNHAIEAMTGIQSADIVGKGNYEYAIPFYGKRRRILIDLVLKRDEKFEKGHYERLVIQGDALVAENYLPHLNIYVYGKASPLYDSKRNVVGAILTIRDITKRKRAEKARASLYRISEAAHTALNLEELYPSIQKIIEELMPAKNFYIAIYDSKTEELTFPYYANETRTWTPPPKKPGKGLTEYVLRTEAPILCTPEVFQEFLESDEVELIGADTIYWLGIPLKTHKKAIGVLAVQSYTEEIRYGEAEQNLLIFVSTQIAVAIERVRAEERLKTLNEELERRVQKRTEELKESEQKLADIINFLPDATFVIDREGKVIAWNHAIEVMTGVQSKDILGKGSYEYAFPLYGKRRRILIDLVLKRDEKFEKKHYERLEIHGDTLAAENYLSHLKIYVYGKASPLYNFEGNVGGAIFTIRDITERKRTEKRLKKLTRQQKALIKLEQKLTSSIRLSEDEILRLIYQNATELMNTDNMYIELYNEESDEVRVPLAFRNGKPIHIATRKAENGIIEDIRKKTLPLQSIKAQTECKKKASVEIGLSWVGVLMSKGEKVIGVIATYNPEKENAYSEDDFENLQSMADLAAIALENARLYQELGKKVEELQEAQKKIAEAQDILTRTGIATDFVHRINNLVGTIPIQVSHIREHLERNLDKQLCEYLDNIDSDVQDLVNAAQQLNTVSIEQDIDVLSELKYLIRQIKVQLPAKYHIHPELPQKLPFIRAVAHEFTNILGSIIQNAIEAMPDGGTLTLRASRDLDENSHEWITILISDTGVGISQNKKEHIFSPFYSSKEGHFGYGLWWAKHVIERMDGSVTFESEEGKGTIFIVKIPAIQRGGEK